MIYFDNAATGGRKPDTVLTAVSSAIKVCANPGRGGHKLAIAAAKNVLACRKELSDFFDGYGAERVVFTKNCTEALNIALLGVLKKGDHVITSVMEHNSVLRPLAYLQETGVIEYDACPLTNGNVTPENILPLLRKNTRLVAISLASNVTGAMPNVHKIRAALPKHVLLLCDGAQAGGHIPVSMKRTGIDMLALAGHKGLLGIQGSGALLFSERVTPAPVYRGGTGSLSVSLDMPDFYPDALEAGTLSYPAILSLLEGVRHLALRQQEISQRLYSLTAYCIERLRQLTAYEVQPNECGIVAFKHTQTDSDILAETLSEKYDIATRGGLHCAPLMHEALNTSPSGLVRASFSHYNSEQEINELLFALTLIK